jgi:translation initiation factor IF-1
MAQVDRKDAATPDDHESREKRIRVTRKDVDEVSVGDLQLTKAEVRYES